MNANMQRWLSKNGVPLLVSSVVLLGGYGVARLQTQRTAHRELEAARHMAEVDANGGIYASVVSASVVPTKPAPRDCTSRWDGSIPNLVERVKSSLRDPSSFEHSNTMVSGPSADGKYDVVMTYRAKNGFGGFNAGVVEATVDGSTCDAQLTGRMG